MIAFLLPVLLTVVCRGAVLVVDDDGPADFRTIQAAVGRADHGDEVVVRPGRYAEDVNFPGTNIVVTSVAPADSGIVRDTVIQGVVQFHGSEHANCVLAGFKIDGWLTFEITGDEVRVTFSPAALDLLRSECTISWIDWYR